MDEDVYRAWRSVWLAQYARLHPKLVEVPIPDFVTRKLYEESEGNPQ